MTVTLKYFIPGLAMWCFAPACPAGELLPPVKIMADGRPTDVQREGHSAPFVGDIDGDGANDLLVGAFFQGRLKVFRNTGTNKAPRFAKPERFMAGGEFGRVPAG